MQEVTGSTPVFSTTEAAETFCGFFYNMYFTYILYSSILDQFYIGHCQDLQDRLFGHNNSGSLATKNANDWVVVYSKQFDSRKEANHLEMIIKRKKSRKYIEWLISQP